ncbi:flavohemoglobin expression-modulating QEGLA motif protein [Pseudofulvibacter geojedonensis]|uniref:Flavohemoglobin expression-modulating QEGLA motif protein n=1 Tax=Pseudofulvibacter geojedonensis TaxID=1123758 RepID=A0ABW3I2V3_9FLAO
MSIEEDYADVFEIDANINRLVRKIELLNYVNPTNISKAKKDFFKSKFTLNPKFKYTKLDFNPYKLQRLFFSQRLERIQDDFIRNLYEDIIYDYSGLIQCIETIGEKDEFYYNSLRSFGTPTEKDVKNAQFILHFKDDELHEDMLPKYSSDEALNFFEAYKKQFGFDFKIVKSNKLSAAAMVLNNTKTLVLNKGYVYSQNEIDTLCTHEIGVHMLTTFNGLIHPLKIFSHGLPRNVETQEGLAVLSEYTSGCLSLKRLKELAYRVIAVDSLAKGYDFSSTFDLLYSQYKLNKDDAFTISLRVHRGGGFTKDYLYLTGLKKLYKFYKNNKDLSPLLTGKVSQKYFNDILKLQEIGLARQVIYTNPDFDKNNNENSKIDFILDNLR